MRPGDENPELRYAIRSWDEHLLYPTGLELWTVGYKPSWLNPDRHIEGNRFADVSHAVFDNIKLISAEAAQSHDLALYMNDDFFCMDPMSSVLPVKRNQTLAEHCAMFPQGMGGWWPESLRLTASWLAQKGITQPDSYEVHRPLLAAPDSMLWALEQWEGGHEGAIPQWRTLYGALCGIPANPVPDVKLSPMHSGFGSPWISTNDGTWRRWMREIVPRFQKPSRWEC